MARGDGGQLAELSAGVRGAAAVVDHVAPISLGRLILAGMVAGGVQYGWALQLSLLTPYVQTLGLSHALTSFMWLCGPIAGLVVQPLVGLYSDRCTSRWGRRRPFILTGCMLICVAVIVVGFSSDIGAALGDTKEHCSLYHGPRWHAAIVYVLGFWLLDFSNNTVQGPARAMMADLCDHHGPSAANSIFCSWMALGNILGYSSGSTNNWHKWFPFLKTSACCEACANLKGAFLVAVVFLVLCLTVTLIFAKEVPYRANENLPTTKAGGEVETEPTGPLAVLKGFKDLPPGMPSVLLVTAITWLSWFPFILYDTDWMGREIYHGDPKGSNAQISAFNEGVRVGAFGLLLNSVILGFSSFLIEPMCRKVGPRVVWVTSNFMVCVAMAATALISFWSLRDYHGYVQDAITANASIKAVCLVLFAFLGVPLAILYSVPFAVTAQLAATRGGGQGLCTGVLNISIVIPQVIIALGAGPWDALFGKGNIPAFGVASAFALVGGVVGVFLLPKISKRQFRAVSAGGH
ncbi:sucrose transport protein SUT1-like [Zea mays]|uniref:Sucrose transport protein SUT3 n=2 Tax=Zea mays TaxID=4577 RepID=A0A804R768_MAIZE|nr:sucrose transport protein SUT1-like [Zea mays]|eukprot:NP_001295053.1 sucrose transport protein SUT1-like [Zea mays]